MAIADRILRARKERRMSQREVAAALKVAPSAVAQWEKGDTEPSIDNRVNISGLLDIPIVELLPDAAKKSISIDLRAQEKLLIEKFRQLPPPMRETYLRLLLVQLDGLTG